MTLLEKSKRTPFLLFAFENFARAKKVQNFDFFENNFFLFKFMVMTYTKHIFI